MPRCWQKNLQGNSVCPFYKIDFRVENVERFRDCVDSDFFIILNIQGKRFMIYCLKNFMKYTLILLCLSVLISGCNSQKNEPKSDDDHKLNFEEFCKTHECRKDLKFRLKTPDDNYFEFSSSLSEPVVQENIDKSDSGGKKKNYLVTVYPGETIHIAFDPGAEGPENLRSVSTAGNYVNTLSFKLSQEENIADGLGMKLYIHNSSGYYIKYWLFIDKIDELKTDKVASCPLKPESGSYETWQHPVFKISMGKFEWADEAGLECK